MMNKKLKILDCTLRDGGYCNDWDFGKDNIVTIINELNKAGIDLIECGILTSKCRESDNKTLFTNIESIVKLSSDLDILNKMVLLMNFGAYDVAHVPHCSNVGINGIRIAFHKPFFKDVFNVVRTLNQKKYRVYLQPMVTDSYSDKELQELLMYANEYEVHSVYIVDSFGSMKPYNIEQLMEIYEEYLKPEVEIGFHAHNNLNLALSNSFCFSQIESQHPIMVDATIMGMGRGAGNLNLEHFIEKNHLGTIYNKMKIEKLRKTIISQIYDNSLIDIRKEYYLSALYGCHPNYATRLIEKGLEDSVLISVFSSIAEDKKIIYDEKYILNLVDYIKDILE